jgi:hypothetical protein
MLFYDEPLNERLTGTLKSVLNGIMKYSDLLASMSERIDQDGPFAVLNDQEVKRNVVFVFLWKR